MAGYGMRKGTRNRHVPTHQLFDLLKVFIVSSWVRYYELRHDDIELRLIIVWTFMIHKDASWTIKD
jgi:hypothetical protein